MAGASPLLTTYFQLSCQRPCTQQVVDDSGFWPTLPWRLPLFSVTEGFQNLKTNYIDAFSPVFSWFFILFPTETMTVSIWIHWIQDAKQETSGLFLFGVSTLTYIWLPLLSQACLLPGKVEPVSSLLGFSQSHCTHGPLALTIQPSLCPPIIHSAGIAFLFHLLHLRAIVFSLLSLFVYFPAFPKGCTSSYVVIPSVAL